MNNEFSVDCVFASSIINVKPEEKRKNATVKEVKPTTVYNECYY